MEESLNTNYTKPHLGELLSILKMDKVFHRAKRNELYSKEGEDEVKYLDFAGGYGASLLGHNHPDLITLARNMLDQDICYHNQLSSKPKLETLAENINVLLHSQTNFDYTSVVLNTGTEAVEAAIKHALLNFNSKLNAINNEIAKELMLIQESHFYHGSRESLEYDGYNINSIEDLRRLIDSLNNDVLLTCNPKIIATNKSFHGKTLGSLSITHNKSYRTPFLKNGPFESIFIDIHDDCPERHFIGNAVEISVPKVTKKGELTFKKRSFNLIAAVVIEPVIGEGGIHVLSGEFFSDLRNYTKKEGIPLIFDEIQSGCFRTGQFLASFHHQVVADYYIIGKALGGGLSKISALAIERSQYHPEFDLLHSSTFAEDDYSTTIAIRSLNLLNENKDRIKSRGDRLLNALKELQIEYPDIIGDVRGLGLMIGVSFEPMNHSSSYGFQGISRSKYFGYVLAAYLLNVKHIRVSVTLSDAYTIRLLPSLYIEEEEIIQLIGALKELCKIIAYGDFYSLISFLLPEQYQNLRPITNFSPGVIQLDKPGNGVDEVGFLLHYIDIDTVRAYLPSLAVLPDNMVLYLVEKLGPFSEPIIIGRNLIRNIRGQEVSITFIGLSFTSEMIIEDMRSSIRNITKYQVICNKAIDLLYGLGITKIGLGQYNSIIMQNGKAVSNPHVRVTTGNGYTVFSVIQKVCEAINTSKVSCSKLGIIGAGGNIAKILSHMVVGHFDQILLLGRTNGSSSKLIDHAGNLIYGIYTDIRDGKKWNSPIYEQIEILSTQIKLQEDASKCNHTDLWQRYIHQFESDKRIEIGTELNLLKDCDVILVATSDPTPFLKKNFIKQGAFICDISVPLNCDDDLLSDPGIKTVKGGIVNLINGENLHPPGLCLNEGEAFACMAETLLMGFEHALGQYSYGEISKSLVIALGNRVFEHGFLENAMFNELVQQLNV